MCGITGILRLKEPLSNRDRDALVGMSQSIEHRGPDDYGYLFGKQIGFAHRRLSIIGLGDEGKQPIRSKCGRYAMVYNGEIYNFQDLSSELIQAGRQVSGLSDTEVLIEFLVHFGVKQLHRVEGIYAFALWDTREKTLTLARDPFGVKPLYYYVDNDLVVFGSEIKAVISHPDVPRHIDPEALDAYFTFSYIPAPMSGVKKTFQVLPGTLFIVSESGTETKQYYDHDFEPHEISESDALDQLEHLLKRAVNSQIIADVSVGSFLSGGLDSSSIAWMIKTMGLDVRLFSLGFSNPEFDESPIAVETANHLELEIEVEHFSHELADLPEKISAHLDGPFADSSSLAFYILSRCAAQHFKVCLSGDGADEILGGYPTYAASMALERNKWLKSPLAKQAFKIGSKLIPDSGARYPVSSILGRIGQYGALSTPATHASWRRTINESHKSMLYTEAFKNQISRDPITSYSQHFGSSGDLLSNLQQMDVRFYLHNDMLSKVDRMSMANSLEVRVPFLDFELVKFCMGLPERLKIKGGEKKRLLRTLVRPHLPQTVIKKPKTGFNVPIADLLRTTWKSGFLESLADTRGMISEWVNPEVIEKLLAEHVSGKDYRYELYNAYIFALWTRNLRDGWKSKLRLQDVDPSKIQII